MSLSRFILGAAAAAFVAATIPAAAHAQSGWKTSCNDGSTTTRTGANACDGHGGIHKVKTTIQHRTPSRSGSVSQAGTPAPAPATKPHYEERRGWRWSRHHDEKRREEKREEKRDEKFRRVRCRDGRDEKVVGKGNDVCKHHGGIKH